MILVFLAALFFSSLPVENTSDLEIVSTPSVLYYDNMAPGESRTQYVEFTNTGKKTIEVLPELFVETDLGEFIDVEMFVCDSSYSLTDQSCDDSREYVILESGEKEKVEVKVTIDKNVSEPFESVAGQNKIVFSAVEADPTDNTDNDVITDNNTITEKNEIDGNNKIDGNIVRTGVSTTMWLTVSIISLSLGTLLVFLSKARRKNDATITK